MLESIYLELMNRLEAIEGIVHVDLYSGQYEKEADGEEIPFPVPAVLIEFTSFPFEELGQKAQEAETDIRFHIASDITVNEVSNSTPTQVRSNALAHLKLIDAVHNSLSGFSGESFSSLSRTQVDTDAAPTSYYIHVVSYKTRVTDTSAVKKLVPAQPNINITSTLETSTQ